jgi:hypothetical protein
MASGIPIFPSLGTMHFSNREMKSLRQPDYTNKAALLYLFARLITGHLQFMTDITNRKINMKYHLLPPHLRE